MEANLFSVWRLLLAATFLCVARAQAADPPKTPPVRDAARDGTGRVWAVDGEQPAGFYALDANEQWQTARPPDIGNEARACCLAARSDQTVVCVWRLGEKSYRVSLHHGDDVRLGPIFSLEERRSGNSLRATADAGNNVWLTQEGPEIYRVAPDGTVDCPHTVSEEECLSGTYHGTEPDLSWHALSVLAEPGGRVWFWTNRAEGYYSGVTIRGALVCEDGKFVQHDFQLPGNGKPQALCLLAQRDAEHLWVAQRLDGLYSLDTTTFQAERVADQPKEAFLTTAAGADNGNWHFVMGETRPDGTSGTLWRLSPNGHWEKLIDGVDRRYKFSRQGKRLWYILGSGAFLGTNEQGMWFLPRDATPPIHVDWQRRFPLATPRRVLDLRNGHWLMLGAGGETWVGALDALVAERAVADNARVRVLRAHSPLRLDARGHLWGTLTRNSPVLQEWDGERWSEHHFPAELGAESYLNVFNFDASGRIWLRSSSQKKWCVIYDPRTDAWEVSDAFEKALEAQIGRPDSDFVRPPTRYDVPRYGPGGRICYLSSQGKVAVYADRTWRQWTRTEITGGQGTSFDGSPFFGRDGRVSVSSDRKTWAFLDEAGWKPVAYEPGPAEVRSVSASSHWQPPAGVQLPFSPDSSVEDNQGNGWLTWQHGVYKCSEGWCVPVLAATEAQAFDDGRRLGSVLIDARGNAFLRDRDNRGEYVIVAPPGPPPQTTVQEEAASPGSPPDRAVVRLTTNAAPVDGKSRFRWHLDDGAWSSLTTEGVTAAVTLDNVPGGRHHFEARSYDAALQTDAQPANLAFEIHLDPVAQVAGYIAQLADPDFSRREAAVAALARQPEIALPALRTARADADEDHRWWLDAAIQQVEATRK